jgi:hypothetical protein
MRGDDNYQVGDLTAGTTKAVSNYASTNRVRLGGAGGSSIGMIAGLALAGPIGLVAGSLIGGSAGKASMRMTIKEEAEEQERVRLQKTNEAWLAEAPDLLGGMMPTSSFQGRSAVHHQDMTSHQRGLGPPAPPPSSPNHHPTQRAPSQEWSMSENNFTATSQRTTALYQNQQQEFQSSTTRSSISTDAGEIIPLVYAQYPPTQHDSRAAMHSNQRIPPSSHGYNSPPVSVDSPDVGNAPPVAVMAARHHPTMFHDNGESRIWDPSVASYPVGPGQHLVPSPSSLAYSHSATQVSSSSLPSGHATVVQSSSTQFQATTRTTTTTTTRTIQQQQHQQEQHYYCQSSAQNPSSYPTNTTTTAMVSNLGNSMAVARSPAPHPQPPNQPGYRFGTFRKNVWTRKTAWSICDVETEQIFQTVPKESCPHENLFVTSFRFVLVFFCCFCDKIIQ